jgi:hypothetical protein
MVVIVGDGVIRRELDEVVRLYLNYVGEEIATLQSEVFYNKVERFVGVLDAGDWDIADFLDQGGQYDFTDVVPEFGLELERALAIKE